MVQARAEQDGRKVSASDLVAYNAAKDIQERAAAKYRRLNSELSLAKATPPPDHPLVNTTDRWVDLILRRAIREAAKEDADAIAIPSGDTVLSYNPGDTDGMRGFYDKIVPLRMGKLLADLDPATPTAKSMAQLVTPTQGAKGAGFQVFPLTEAAIAAAGKGLPMFALRTFHGTPHNFEPEPGAPAGRFRSEKIGTGEGAQAFGYGHYTAEAEGVAKWYKEKLAGHAPKVTYQHNGRSVVGSPSLVNSDFDKVKASSLDIKEEYVLAIHANEYYDKTWPGFIDALNAGMAFYKSRLSELSEGIAELEKKSQGILYRRLRRPEIIRTLERYQQDALDAEERVAYHRWLIDTAAAMDVTDIKVSAEPRGRLLGIDVDVEPDQLLDLDQPLSGQPAAVAAALRSLGYVDDGQPVAKPTAEVAAKLAALGIPGAWFKDQMSRGKEEGGSRNVIVFPGAEDRMTITHVDGRPILWPLTEQDKDTGGMMFSLRDDRDAPAATPEPKSPLVAELAAVDRLDKLRDLAMACRG